MSELPPLPEPIEAWEFAPSAKLFTRDQIQAYARAAIEAAKAEQVRPDILENLSYHRLERDDLTLDNCLSYLAEGWRKVHGRTERQMVMQILELLASAPTPEPMSAPTEAKPATQQASGEQKLADGLILAFASLSLEPTREMVERFLMWKLPDDFAPDNGVSFKRESDYDHPEFGRTKYEPTGTNLLNYDQARGMLKHVLATTTRVALSTPPAQAQDAVDAVIPLDKDELAQLIAEHLGGTYHCTRVWEAWNVGTMSREDFEPVDESETPTEIADAIIDAIRAAISAKKGGAA